MTGTAPQGLQEIPPDRSVIVVSDLHLGGAEDPETSKRFCRFLDYIENHLAATPLVCCRGDPEKMAGAAEQKSLLPPEKIILLGDVFELWDTRNTDRNNAFLDGLYPFLKMRDLDCDIVYVSGNHDEDSAELITSRLVDNQKMQSGTATATAPPAGPPSKTGNPAPCDQNYQVYTSPPQGLSGTRRAECLLMNLKPSRGSKKPHVFEICRRHYPAIHLAGGEEGLRVGEKRYAFVHGQQFDDIQITYTISEVLGQRFDPVDFIEDLASISSTGNAGPASLVLNLLLTAALLLVPLLAGFLVPVLGFWFGMALIFALTCGAGLFLIQDQIQGISALIVAGICAGLSIIAIGLVLFHQLVWLYVIAVAMSLFITLTIALPRCFAFIKRRVYNFFSSKEDSPEDLIEKKRFLAAKYRYNAEVLVFGHTHVADFSAVPSPGSGPLLVNTGTWVRDGTRAAAQVWDTFVYIDHTGICLMRWVDKGNNARGHVECLCRMKSGKMTPLCRV